MGDDRGLEAAAGAGTTTASGRAVPAELHQAEQFEGFGQGDEWGIRGRWHQRIRLNMNTKNAVNFGVFQEPAHALPTNDPRLEFIEKIWGRLTEDLKDRLVSAIQEHATTMQNV